MTATDCRESSNDPRHRFTCPACRAGAREAAAWEALPDPRDSEAPVECSEAFVARVLQASRRDRAAARRRTVWMAAAAALLFSFFAGLSRENASAPAPSAADAWASLASPDDLEGLIPN